MCPLGIQFWAFFSLNTFFFVSTKILRFLLTFLQIDFNVYPCEPLCHRTKKVMQKCSHYLWKVFIMRSCYINPFGSHEKHTTVALPWKVFVSLVTRDSELGNLATIIKINILNSYTQDSRANNNKHVDCDKMISDNIFIAIFSSLISNAKRISQWHMIKQGNWR